MRGLFVFVVCALVVASVASEPSRIGDYDLGDNQDNYDQDFSDFADDTPDAADAEAGAEEEEDAAAPAAADHAEYALKRRNKGGRAEARRERRQARRRARREDKESLRKALEADMTADKTAPSSMEMPMGAPSSATDSMAAPQATPVQGERLSPTEANAVNQASHSEYAPQLRVQHQAQGDAAGPRPIAQVSTTQVSTAQVSTTQTRAMPADARKVPCPNACSGNGRCTPGGCVCMPGYGGEDCSSALTCLNDCSLNGRCKNGVCFCKPGFGGEDCSLKSNGTAGAVDNYVIAKGLTDVLVLRFYDDYQRRSEPDQAIVDLWTDAFLGGIMSLREVEEAIKDNEKPPVLSCKNNCTGHGTCFLGHCVCDTGYDADDCSTRTCPNDCSGHGRCDKEKGECICKDRWQGADCSSACPPGRWGTNCGTTARSCYEVLQKGYSSGDGMYWLQPNPNKNPFKAFCNMTMNGGGWTRIYRLSTSRANTQQVFFGMNQFEKNKMSPRASQYSLFDDLEYFKRDGRFELLMQWPDGLARFSGSGKIAGPERAVGVNHWFQSSNPRLDSYQSPTEPQLYTPVEVTYNGGGFGGLQRNTCTSCSLFDGSVAGSRARWWWFSVGLNRCWNASRAPFCSPGPVLKGPSYDIYYVTETTEVYVR